jgi:hypothetical protein
MNFASKRFCIPLVAVSLLLTCVGAQAQSVRVLGDHRDWSAYSSTGNGGKLCFALSKPQDVRPAPADYTQSYMYLTHRPAEGVRNEMNFVAGFDLAPERPATLNIGGQEFALFVDNGAAWLDNTAQAEAVAGAMRAGSVMRVSVTAADGTEVVETFSLSGVTAASRSIDRECS